MQKNGKMFILVDDKNRENEGDLIFPAQMCDAKKINFMAKYGRGLICLALDEKRVNELNLPLMSMDNQSRNRTAFTVSIEAKYGITTGISAADRSKTILDAINSIDPKDSIVSPGHIFPLKAKNGGVLVRAGHTEAAVDIARIAGLNPSGVICEIMNDDGTMARMPDLIKFAQEHSLKIATIADLIEYRNYNDKLVEKKEEGVMNSMFGGEFKTIIYKDKVNNSEHLVLIKGDISDKDSILVRMHHTNLFYDSLGAGVGKDSSILVKSMNLISKNNCGVIVLINDRRESLFDMVTICSRSVNSSKPKLKNYGIGAQILVDLGITNMTLLTNAVKPIIGLEGYGLRIKGYKNIN